jgi:hypothetical protein
VWAGNAEIFVMSFISELSLTPTCISVYVVTRLLLDCYLYNTQKMSHIPPHQSGASSSHAGTSAGPPLPGPSSDIVMQSHSASLRAPSPRPNTPLLSRRCHPCKLIYCIEELILR